MKLSDDKINYLSHVITDALAGDEGVEFRTGRNDIRLLVKRSISRVLSEDEGLEQVAVAKVRSLKRGVAEGSPEWDILVRRYYFEELEKLRGLR